MNEPTTGPEAIEAYLANLDLKKLEEDHRHQIKHGGKTKRARSVRILNAIDGFKRNNVAPKDLMVRSVPVIPPQFRPFSAAGSTFIPGDANEMYKDLIEYKKLYEENAELLGHQNSGHVYKDLNNAVRAVYGFGESPNPKTVQRKVKGFFQQITGTGPKHSFMQAKLMSKTQDTVGRGVIIPDADYDMNEIGLPANMAWTIYANYVQRRLVQGGMAPGQALKHVKERSDMAKKALEAEFQVRPVVYTRAPSWHKFNVVAGTPRLVDGDAIRINT